MPTVTADSPLADRVAAFLEIVPVEPGTATIRFDRDRHEWKVSGATRNRNGSRSIGVLWRCDEVTEAIDVRNIFNREV